MDSTPGIICKNNGIKLNHHGTGKGKTETKVILFSMEDGSLILISEAKQAELLL